MRIEVPHLTERFGAVRIYGVQQVIELDSGLTERGVDLPQGQMVQLVSHEDLHKMQQRMAIVVPCKAERVKVLRGVLSGIPHDCLIILVSNSPREPVDRFEMERDTVADYCHAAQRSAVLVHQRDPGLARAFHDAGLEEVLDADGLVRHGKGEGMLIGAAIARLAGVEFVGFIDADNYVPGAVHEYVKAYSAGLHLAKTPFAMVRISWHSKPKIQDGRLFFNRWGRSSQITNRFLNLLLSEYSGFGTEVITTGNAGEHALSTDLAVRMRFAAGFAVEPYQYLNLFELFGGVLPSPYPDVMRGGVEIFQIETRNPHFHENKGSGHVQEMRLQALNVLYHSPICLDAVREEIVELLREQGVLSEDELPPEEGTYPPLVDLDWETFLRVLESDAKTFQQIQRAVAAGVVVEKPIPTPSDAAVPEPWLPAEEPTTIELP